MAKKPTTSPKGVGAVEDCSLPRVLDKAYVKYSTHAILQRAIPDARDGLKPAQRRLLYAMDRLGLSDGDKYVKCAKVCGYTSGDFHPHGESVLYPTLVRLVQDWLLRYPLVSGQGNFGTVDGLDAAAMRYTEARLSVYGAAVVDDVDGDAVNFQPNYTDSDKEPVVMPGLFPNLLCNGGSGIAVGVACNFAPHNLREVAAVIRECAVNPNPTVERLLELMPGPDFPTGGTLRGQSAVKQYYSTGKGTVVLDGKWEVSKDAKGVQSITVTQLPYGSSPDRLAQQVADLVQNKRLEGVTDLKELSHRDKTGQKHICVVFILAKEADSDRVIKVLLRHTCLRSTFSVNHTAIVDGRAGEGVSLVDLARSYYAHRREVLKRRSEQELIKLTQRIHVLEGLVGVCGRIREVVEVILACDSPASARAQLVSDGYVKTDEQAAAVLEISLKRLTRMEIDQLMAQKTEAEKKANKLTKLLGSEKAMREAVLQQLDDFADKYGDDRRTALGPEPEAVGTQDLIQDENVTVFVSREGFVWRSPAGAGTTGMLSADTRLLGRVVFVTNKGMAYCRFGHDIPEPGKGKGTHIGQLLGCRPDETVLSVYDVDEVRSAKCLLATRGGLIKKMPGSLMETKKRAGIPLLKLGESDSLLCADKCPDAADVFVATANGKGVRYPASSVPVQGRGSAGVTAMRLAAGDAVAQVVLLEKDFDGYALFVTSLGYVKKTSATKFRCYSGRMALGMNTIDNIKKDRTGVVVGMVVLPKNGSFAVHTREGGVMVIGATEVRDSERPVRTATLDKGDELVAVTTA
ncbi:MAG: hypothetical protein JSS66_04760 [Armatimonadetes bacterium]|nr:hypothetical protein [Armatimonadota bacterium]